jgi:ornithine carbamoyltransferase
MYQLGGSVVHLTTGDSQLGRSEPIEDSAKVISRMVDLVMIRTYGQDKINSFAANSRVPVINGLTNEFHPCQILADLFTYIEHRGHTNHPLQCLHGKVVAWVGDGNNMANTWLQAADMLGFTVHVSTPSGYEVNPAIAGLSSSQCFKVFKDPMQACRGADLVTTDVWTSMGYEADSQQPTHAGQKLFSASTTRRLTHRRARHPCQRSFTPWVLPSANLGERCAHQPPIGAARSVWPCHCSHAI